MREDYGGPGAVAEGGKSERHAESCQRSRCVERNDRQRYEARHLMDGCLNCPYGGDTLWLYLLRLAYF